MATSPAQDPGQVTILVEPPLGSITIQFVWRFYTFSPQNYLPPWGCGVMKLTISCLLTLLMPHTKFGED